MKAKHLLFSLLGICLFFACEQSPEIAEAIDPPAGETPVVENPLIIKDVFSGYVQKGPFIVGSSVAIQELDENLDQTGKSYSATIASNLGDFELKNIKLVSNFVQLKADGYYFNEITGRSSTSIVTLYALADVSNASSVNVNVLTHLERERTAYLIEEMKMPFSEAKKQAQKEVLKIFSMSPTEEVSSDQLNLVNNAVLLAISCILQGNFPEATMVELMANICAEIRTDGTLDNPDLGSRLLDNALSISLPDIRKNMEKKYIGQNGTTSIPDFESQINSFIKNTSFVRKAIVTYPENSASGVNILSEKVTYVMQDSNYYMTAEVPEGNSLKIVIRGGLWYYQALPAPLNWSASTYNAANEYQEFTVTEGGKPNELLISFARSGIDENGKHRVTIEYYENKSLVPILVKKLEVKVAI